MLDILSHWANPQLRAAHVTIQNATKEAATNNLQGVILGNLIPLLRFDEISCGLYLTIKILGSKVRWDQAKFLSKISFSISGRARPFSRAIAWPIKNCKLAVFPFL
jgi:hypothetical protein